MKIRKDGIPETQPVDIDKIAGNPPAMHDGYLYVDIHSMPPVDAVLTPEKSATTTRTSISASTVAQVFLAANSGRKGATIYNASPGKLYLALGNTMASDTDYTILMTTNSYYEVPFAFTGKISGVWTNNNGSAIIGEMT